MYGSGWDANVTIMIALCARWCIVEDNVAPELPFTSPAHCVTVNECIYIYIYDIFVHTRAL